jgi:hypothetical protein
MSFNNLNDFRKFIAQPVVDNTSDVATLFSGSAQLALNGANDFIKTYSNRTFLSGSLATESFYGKGYNGRLELIHNKYIPLQGPIVGTPLLKYRTASTWITVTDSWEVDDTCNYIYFTDGCYFVDDQFYKLTYEYGYTANNIPNDLKMAELILAKYYYESGKFDHLTTQSDGVQNFTYGISFPKHALVILDKYKR